MLILVRLLPVTLQAGTTSVFRAADTFASSVCGLRTTRALCPYIANVHTCVLKKALTVTFSTSNTFPRPLRLLAFLKRHKRGFKD